MGNFDWTKLAIDAAEMLAEGRLSAAAIAEKVGIGRTTLHRWQKDPEFAARVDELVEEFAKEAKRRGLAVLARRVAAQNDRWQRLQRVIEERADDPQFENVAGGRTGLITVDWKTLGAGDSAQIMPIYSVDTGLLKELREHEKLAAQELGQWEERLATTKEPTVIQVQMVEATPLADADD